MKKFYFRLLLLIPLLALLVYYGVFYETKVTDEDAHVTELIEKLPEYIDLDKKNDGYVHIDFPKDTSNIFINANILTFRLNSDPAKIVYRVQYDKHLDKITSVKKE